MLETGNYGNIFVSGNFVYWVGQKKIGNYNIKYNE